MLKYENLYQIWFDILDENINNQIQKKRAQQLLNGYKIINRLRFNWIFNYKNQKWRCQYLISSPFFSPHTIYQLYFLQCIW